MINHIQLLEVQTTSENSLLADMRRERCMDVVVAANVRLARCSNVSRYGPVLYRTHYLYYYCRPKFKYMQVGSYSQCLALNVD